MGDSTLHGARDDVAARGETTAVADEQHLAAHLPRNLELALRRVDAALQFAMMCHDRLKLRRDAAAELSIARVELAARLREVRAHIRAAALSLLRDAHACRAQLRLRGAAHVRRAGDLLKISAVGKRSGGGGRWKRRRHRRRVLAAHSRRNRAEKPAPALNVEATPLRQRSNLAVAQRCVALLQRAIGEERIGVRVEMVRAQQRTHSAV